MAIRNAAKAVMLYDGKILVNQCVNAEHGVFYDLPGGGQHLFESMEDAVIREVLEETGYHVKIDRFLGVAEEIYDNPITRKKYFEYAHRILHIFLVSLVSNAQSTATELDFQQSASVWMPLSEADTVTFHPTSISGKITSLVASSTPQHLGVVRMP